MNPQTNAKKPATANQQANLDLFEIFRVVPLCLCFASLWPMGYLYHLLNFDGTNLRQVFVIFCCMCDAPV
jgi:hypothetical protein